MLGMPFFAELEFTQGFSDIAKASGFSFNLYRGRVDWKKIDSLDVDRLVRERDLESLNVHISNVTNCNLESEYDVKILDANFVKLFRLAQLTIDFLLHCKCYLERRVDTCQRKLQTQNQEITKLKKECQSKQSEVRRLRRKLREKTQLIAVKTTTDSVTFKCMLCGKLFVEELYLRGHHERRHPSQLYNSTTVHPPKQPSPNPELPIHLEAVIAGLRHQLKVAEAKLYGHSLQDDVVQQLYDRSTTEAPRSKPDYQQEIDTLKSMFYAEIKKLKEQGSTPAVCEKNNDIDDSNLKKGELAVHERVWSNRLAAIEKQHQLELHALRSALTSSRYQEDSKNTVDDKVTPCPRSESPQRAQLFLQTNPLQRISDRANSCHDYETGAQLIGKSLSADKYDMATGKLDLNKVRVEDLSSDAKSSSKIAKGGDQKARLLSQKSFHDNNLHTDTTVQKIKAWLDSQEVTSQTSDELDARRGGDFDIAVIGKDLTKVEEMQGALKDKLTEDKQLINVIKNTVQNVTIKQGSAENGLLDHGAGNVYRKRRSTSDCVSQISTATKDFVRPFSVPGSCDSSLKTLSAKRGEILSVVNRDCAVEETCSNDTLDKELMNITADGKSEDSLTEEKKDNRSKGVTNGKLEVVTKTENRQANSVVMDNTVSFGDLKMEQKQVSHARGSTDLLGSLKMQNEQVNRLTGNNSGFFSSFKDKVELKTNAVKDSSGSLDSFKGGNKLVISTVKESSSLDSVKGRNKQTISTARKSSGSFDSFKGGNKQAISTVRESSGTMGGFKDGDKQVISVVSSGSLDSFLDKQVTSAVRESGSKRCDKSSGLFRILKNEGKQVSSNVRDSSVKLKSLKNGDKEVKTSMREGNGENVKESPNKEIRTVTVSVEKNADEISESASSSSELLSTSEESTENDADSPPTQIGKAAVISDKNGETGPGRREHMKNATMAESSSGVVKERSHQFRQSMEAAVASNPAILIELRSDLELVLGRRLRELGVDPEWCEIPATSFHNKMAALQQRQKIAAKKHKGYYKLREKILEEVELRLEDKVRQQGKQLGGEQPVGGGGRSDGYEAKVVQSGGTSMYSGTKGKSVSASMPPVPMKHPVDRPSADKESSETEDSSSSSTSQSAPMLHKPAALSSDTKSALRSASSTGNLAKKRVLFVDQAANHSMDDAEVVSVSRSRSRSDESLRSTPRDRTLDLSFLNAPLADTHRRVLRRNRERVTAELFSDKIEHGVSFSDRKSLETATTKGRRVEDLKASTPCPSSSLCSSILDLDTVPPHRSSDSLNWDLQDIEQNMLD